MPVRSLLSSENRWRALIGLVVLGTLLLGLEEARRTGLIPGERTYVPLFTARGGGAFVKVGGRLRELVKKDHASRIQLVEIPSGGSKENLDSMTEFKNAISFTFVRVPDILQAPEKYSGVRAIALLNRDIVQVVASKASHVERVEQFGEQVDNVCKYHVYVGMTGSGTLATATKLLKLRFPKCFNEWEKASQNMTYSEASTQLRGDTLQAAIFSTGIGASAVEDLFVGTNNDERRFNLLGLDENERNSLADHEEADTELYGVKVHTVSARVVIATNADTEGWIVRELVSALERNGGLLDGSLTRLQPTDDSPLVTEPAKIHELVPGVPLHDARTSTAFLLTESPSVSLGAVTLLLALQLGLLLKLRKPPALPPLKAEFKHRVFVSYDKSDLKFVQDVLVPHLEKHRIGAWWSALIPGGSCFQNAIASAIDGVEWVVVVLSPDTSKSLWVKFETEYAMNTGKGVLPVIIRHPCIPRDAHIGFSSIQHIDLTENRETGLMRLVARLREPFATASEPGSSGASRTEALAPEASA